MSTKFLPILAAGVLALALSGCATITRGTSNQVTFQSEPSGADMQTSSGLSCVTPCTLTVPRKSEFTAVFRKPGYQDAQVAVQTQIAGNGAAGFAGNILVGGVVGMAADAASGATLEHTPNPVIANMTPLPSTAKPHVRRGHGRRAHPGS